MSKLTDRLDALGRVTPTTMGFTSRVAVKPTATMLLLGSAPAGDASKYASCAGPVGVDVLLLRAADSLSNETLKKLPRKNASFLAQ